MKKQNQDEMLEEYDFSNGTRGKYVKQYNDGINIIKLDNDVKKIFPDAKSVNNALRTLINLIPQNQNNSLRFA
jgi:ASC-1-like (ASCH) protein